MTPDREPALDPVRLPRRILVGGALWTGALVGGGGLITACNGPDPGSSESPPPKPKPDPDLPVVTSALAQTRRLLDLYAATAKRHPKLQDGLAGYLQRHRAHLEALSDGSAGPKPSPTPSPTASPSTPTASASPVAASAGAAVQALVALEKSAAAARTEGLTRARNPELARLLASIGACEAVHAIALEDLANG